jgi:hypothetical protein
LTPDIVHENVQSALFFLDSSDQRAHLVGHEMVNLDGDPAPARLIHKMCGLFDRFWPIHFRSLGSRCSTGDVNRRSSRAQLHSDPSSCPRVAPATNATLPASGFSMCCTVMSTPKSPPLETFELQQSLFQLVSGPTLLSEMTERRGLSAMGCNTSSIGDGAWCRGFGASRYIGKIY